MKGRVAAEFPDGDIASIEQEFVSLLGKPLDRWLEGEFFTHHMKQFKKRPITWQLQTGSFTTRKKPAFACLCYYHKLDVDFLPKIRTQYVGPLRSRMETELRGIEAVTVANRSDRQETRRVELEGYIAELKAFDEALAEIVATGFGPAPLRKKLRQYAINDATLHLKWLWLGRLREELQKIVLEGWLNEAERAELHGDSPTWVAESLEHLPNHCATIVPKPPREGDLAADPTSAELAAHICPHAKKMVKEGLVASCGEWWPRLDQAVFAPIRENVKQLQTELDDLESEMSAEAEPSQMQLVEIIRRQKGLRAEIKALRKDLKAKQDRGKDLRKKIENTKCPEAENWESWLASQPLYDQVSAIDDRRAPPATVAEWIAQESRYIPDINDGVRVNIAPIQKVGILATDVLAAKDVDKAIADRAEWRADERRWVREGKLPRVGWWPREEDK